MAEGRSRTTHDVDELRTRRLVVTDEDGVGRICLAADGDLCTIRMLDRDGFERIALAVRPDTGAVVVSALTQGQPTRVDVFALDAEGSDDVPTVGLELIDAGNSTGGVTVRAGSRARVWTEPLV